MPCGISSRYSNLATSSHFRLSRRRELSDNAHIIAPNARTSSFCAAVLIVPRVTIRTVISSTVFVSPVDGIVCGWVRSASGMVAIWYNASSPSLSCPGARLPTPNSVWMIIKRLATESSIPISASHSPHAPLATIVRPSLSVPLGHSH